MKDNPPPIDSPVISDAYYFLPTEKHKLWIPSQFYPENNHGNYVISLGKLCRWMADQATELGVDIFPGTPGSEILYNDNGEVRGVATGDFGISKKG